MNKVNKYNISLSKRQELILKALYSQSSYSVNSIQELTELIYNNQNDYHIVKQSLYALIRKGFIVKEVHFIQKLNKFNKLYSHNLTRLILNSDYINFINYITQIMKSRKKINKTLKNLKEIK